LCLRKLVQQNGEHLRVVLQQLTNLSELTPAHATHLIVHTLIYRGWIKTVRDSDDRRQ
jgi:DNA-binding MarR family transcriptional regulator